MADDEEEVQALGGQAFQNLMTKLADGALGEGVTLDRLETQFVMRAVVMILDGATAVAVGKPVRDPSKAH